MLNEKEQLQYPVFNEYLQILQNMDIPKECTVKNYRMNNVQRRKLIKLYRNALFTNGRDTKNERNALVAKIKVGDLEQFPKLLTPQMQIAKICADECVNHAGMYYLIEKIAIHMMAEDFDDEMIELSDLWYNLNNLKDRVNYEQKMDRPDWNCIIGFALASRMYQNYLFEPEKVSKDIKKLVPRKGSLGELFTDYGVTIDNSEIITDLRRQEKTLIKKRH